MTHTLLFMVPDVGGLLALAFLTAVLAAPAEAGVAAPLAVVTDVHGLITLEREGVGEATPLTHSEVLYPGDVLWTGQDGHATLFQRHAPLVALAPQRTIAITPLPPVARDDVLTTERFDLIIKYFDDALQRADETSTEATRGADEVAITVLAPRLSLVLETRPTFVWTPVPDAASYKITLYDQRDNILWQTTTAEPQVAYPADREPLAAGEYAWDVLVTVGNRRGLDTAPFTIASAAEAAAVRRLLEQATSLVSDTNRTNLPYLAVAFEHRLYPQAEAVLHAATARTPRDRVLWELLMRLYQLTERGADRERTRPIRAGSR